jgi:hypothetical protein
MMVTCWKCYGRGSVSDPQYDNRPWWAVTPPLGMTCPVCCGTGYLWVHVYPGPYTPPVFVAPTLVDPVFVSHRETTC